MKFPHTLFSITHAEQPLITLLQEYDYMWQGQAMCKISSSEVFVFKGQV